MKILITGISGFVGGHVFSHLVKNGFDATGITTSKTEMNQIHGCYNSVLNVDHLSDLCDYDLEGTIILHCAWENVFDTRNLSHFQHVNEQIRFINKLNERNCDRLYILGSCLEYGNQSGEVSFSDPTIPVIPYAQAKVFLKQYCDHVFSGHNTQFSWLRLFRTYGRGQHKKTLFGTIDDAVKYNTKIFKMTGGEQLCDFLPIEEISSMIEILIKYGAPSVVNLESGNAVKLSDVVKDYVKKNNYEITIDYGGVKYRDDENFALWSKESFYQQITEYV